VFPTTYQVSRMSRRKTLGKLSASGVFVPGLTLSSRSLAPRIAVIWSVFGGDYAMNPLNWHTLGIIPHAFIPNAAASLFRGQSLSTGSLNPSNLTTS